MSASMATVQIPQTLYRRLERMAHLTHHSLEEVLTQTLESTVPPLPDSWPPEMRAELLALEILNDDELWRVARSQMSAEQHVAHAQLLEKNSDGQLLPHERAQLEQFRRESDRIMLSKAYAYALLKWRGYRLPTMAEMEAQA